MLNEVIRSSGDVRRLIAECMQDVRAGKMDAAQAQAIAALSKELTASMQAEVNVAKVNITLRKEGMGMRKISHMGQLLIDGGTVPILSGQSDDSDPVSA